MAKGSSLELYSYALQNPKFCAFVDAECASRVSAQLFALKHFIDGLIEIPVTIKLISAKIN